MDTGRAQRVLGELEGFLTGQPGPRDDPRRRAVDLFHQVAASVPAYQDFLRDNEVDPGTVHTFEDFQRLPVLTKQTYHNRHPLPRLCRDGRLDSCDVVAVSSGSSGEPTFWPRFLIDELAAAARFEQVFRDSFQAGSRDTLAVVCFPLGTWVGGLYTLACLRHLAAKGYPIITVAPGNNKSEILRVVPGLGRHVDQVVLLGYPPFIKDVVDTGLAAGLDWSRFSVKLVLAGEVFSEQWRELLGRRTGMRDPRFDSAALYGTADAGVLGNETPLSVTIRRFLAGTPDVARELFGQSRLPTLVQYDPAIRFFESRDGTLLFSADNGIPLIRYDIADEGGIIGHDELLAFCARHGFDPLADLGVTTRVHPLPFVYVFGRTLFTVSFFGANIYPENITAALEHPPVSDWVTGKFVVQVIQDADQDQHLRVIVELAPGQHSDRDHNLTIAESIRTELVRLNSEFAHYVPAEHQLPEVIARPASDPEYFPAGVKHRYTRA